MSQTATFRLDSFLSGNPPHPLVGVDVVLQSTRSRIKRLQLLPVDLPGKASRYVNKHGHDVYRWTFDEAGVDVLPQLTLLVEYEQQPVEIASVQALASVETWQLLKDLHDRNEIIRNWFKTYEQQVESDPSLCDAQKRGRLFFLELDRLSSPAVLDATRESQQWPDDPQTAHCIIQRLGGYLSRRVMGRVDEDPDRVDRVPIEPDDIEWTSRLFAQAWSKLQRGKAVPSSKVLLDAFIRFSAGDFIISDPNAHSNGRPDGGFFFFFAELALVASRHAHTHQATWQSLLGPIVMAQQIFMEAYGPAPMPFIEWGDRLKDKSLVPKPLDPPQRTALTKGWDDARIDWNRQIDCHVIQAFGGKWD